MDLSTVISVVKTALTVMETLEQLKATFSFSHTKNELERFQRTVNAVQAVLKDAESHQGAFNHQETNYIEELKDAVYDANDVIDEFVTLVKQKRSLEASDKVSDKVRSFLSRFSLSSRNLSDKVKDINNKLNDIASNSKLRLTFDSKPVNKLLKRDTSSCVSVDNPIIGRGEDLEKIVEMLLSSDDVHPPNNVLSLAIVGMGGLGKTAFAQLVYSDPRIVSAFQLRSWTCIADHDKWNLTHLLGKIVRHSHDQNSLEQMHHEIKKQLEGKKYLLVLDDVWTESYIEWKELENYLMVGETGSRIVVTTRSKKTAEIVGGVRVHELQGLSKDESWRLFERTAFRQEQSEHPDEEYVKLGKDIVTRCFNVPLGIKVVGSLLNGETKQKWLSFRDKELAHISEGVDAIEEVLSLSYHQLDSSLKSCFTYCAIFPKDFRINKKLLFSLWMAQGYINTENMGEEYFRILLQRSFFQEVKVNLIGEIKSFKIHDLLHDIAEKSVVNEVCRLNAYPSVVDRKVRHLSLSYYDYCPQGTVKKTHIHTCLQGERSFLWNYTKKSISDQLLAGKLIANWSSLRSLDMTYLVAKKLPESIGNLFHLRYLNLAYSSSLKVLPDSITKLVNLQTLDLSNCSRLEELPKDVHKLLDLVTLNISGCYKLRYMPSKLDLLTNLHSLGLFVVGGASSSAKRCFSGLKLLSKLNNLKGSLEIYFNVGKKNAEYVKEDHGGGAYLISKIHLQDIHINFTNVEDESAQWKQALLKEMQPHKDIRTLTVSYYHDEKMPRWPMREDSSTISYFPNLVKLVICKCCNLQLVPSLEKLTRLKKLELCGLENLEYVVNVNLEECSLREGTTFFPCLEKVELDYLPKLKGWWPGSVPQNEKLIGEPFSCFGQLKLLLIDGCPMIRSIPICSGPTSVVVDDMYTNIGDNHMTPEFKSLLPSESKSRMITLSYLETLLGKYLNELGFYQNRTC